jgi:hypothetical protein
MMYPAPGYNQPMYPIPQYNISQQHPMNAIPTLHITQPHFNTIGLTAPELIQQQMATAQGLEMNKPQEMKPADPDPLRMYWVREQDGTWTQRNLLTINSGDIGQVRWYAQSDGVFYAVRLPSG